MTADRLPTALHVQFLRGGDAGTPVRYHVERMHDGRTTSSRRVLGRQADRTLVSATALFVVPTAGPEHTDEPERQDPEALDRTGPIGPAPSLAPEEVDIRIRDDRTGGDFVRELWWRISAAPPDDPILHACLAVYVTDIYGVDPVLAVHGYSMTDRSHHCATTDFINLVPPQHSCRPMEPVESRSPAAARGWVMTAALYNAGGVRWRPWCTRGQAVRREQL